MYLLISIVFIAELIIATSLIVNLLKVDKQVTVLNNQVISGKDVVTVMLIDIKNIIINLKAGVKSFSILIKKKQEEYTIKTIQSVVLYALMILCKGKYKKAAIIFQLIVAIRGYMRDSRV